MQPTKIPLVDRLVSASLRHGLRGATRLSRFTGKSDKLLVRASCGAVFLLNPSGYIDRFVIHEGDYESEVRLEIEESAQIGDAIWDIGANFGLHCVTLGKRRQDLKIVAFEPNPIEHARLMLHRGWNAPHIQTCSVALSDRTAMIELHLGPPGNSGMTTLSPWSKTSYTETILVAAVEGDGLIASGRIPSPNIIKLDVEGHEAAVLRGLRQTLNGAACRMVVFEDGPDRDTEPKQLLRTAGFEVSPLLRNEHTAHALSNFVARKTHHA